MTEAPSELTVIPVPGEAPVAQSSVLDVIIQISKDPSVDVAKYDALLRLQERMEAREAEKAFNRAMAAMNETPLRVSKRGTVSLGAGKGGYKFARWEDMDAVIRPLMQQHGLTLSFNSEMRPGDGGGLIVTGTLLHIDGHSRSASIPLGLDAGAGRNNLQAMGSTLSYGKRYVAEMLLNIVREDVDDDGRDGGTRFITLPQAEQIEALIAEVKADRPRFLRHLGVNSLTEIEADKFDAAINALNEKKRKSS